MKNLMCTCPSCGRGLGCVLAWARLLGEEPAELTYLGPWGHHETWTVGGNEVLAVSCPRCGAQSAVGRNCPSASA